MLIRFGVSNYRSIRDYQELSLVASALKDQEADLIEPTGIREKLLPIAMIYGANASGKSTILSAISFLRGAVVFSNERSPSSKIPRFPFALSENYKGQPTRVDCDFLHDNVRYHFGFTARDDFFEEEWLFAFPDGNRRKWYYRKHGERISFGKHFKGKNQAIAALTRPNTLFLSSAAQNAHEQATMIFRFFESMFSRTITATLNHDALANELRDGIDSRILEFLRLADTGIAGGHVREVPVPDEVNKVFSRIKDVAAEEFSDVAVNIPGPKRTLSLSHATGTNSEDPIFFDLTSESRGTLRLLKLLRPIFSALDSGATVFVDEIDGSIHTLLSKAVLGLFSSSKTNPKGAQLVATTHDTTLLCSRVLRRDQIWFTEKDLTGATSLYPLSDIRTRQADNLEKGYLEGRFGAIPFLGDLKNLLKEETPIS
jgi:AAA15 family ATPase/GTPase